MKLIIVLMTTLLIQAGAAGFAQKVTLNETNVSLGNVFNKIRLQTGYDFVFNSKEVRDAKKVTINVNNVGLEEALRVLFKDQNLNYSVKDKFIVIEPARPSIIDNLRAVFINIDVSGRVVDAATGEPLSGANVMAKGRKQGTRTSADGTFFLQNVEKDATLVITYTGYITKEITASKDIGIIRMEVAVGNLQEVGVTVNTGYQRIKPEQSTGAVSQIGTKEYESRVSANFLDGLVNRLPGLMINNTVNFNSTAPDGSTSSRPLFNIRGISTMSANQNPLIVVDGYPTELTLDMIDPNEIKSVTILKDAASATVYGVRASNGVIVIERKQANPGAAQFSFRTTLGLTPEENYSRYRWDPNASAINANYTRDRQILNITPNTWSTLFTPGTGSIGRSIPFYIQSQLAAGIISSEQAEKSFAELTTYDNLKDYNRLFQRMAATQTNTLNVSGGVPNALYYITANYTGNRNNKILNDNNRFLLTGRTTLKLAKRLSLELTTEYQEQRVNNAPVPGVSDFAGYEHYQDVNGNPASIISRSFAPVFNNYIMSQGLLDQNYYPLIDVNLISDKTRTVNNKVTANFQYDVGKGFNLLFGGVYESSSSEVRHLARQGSSEVNAWINNYTVTDGGAFKKNIPDGDFLRQQNTSSIGYTARTQLNYNKRIGDHSFNAIAGAEIRSILNKGNLASYFGYNDQSLLQQPVDYASIFNGLAAVRGTLVTSDNLGSLTDFFNQTYTEDRFVSAFSNIVYSFKDTYSLSGSIRIDQSNLFGSDPKYKYKPLWSLGAAWNIQKEDFMSNVNWLHQLKLRSAFGFNGNVAKLSLPQVIAQAALNYQNTPTLTSLILASNANSGLRWEQTQNFNLGLDFSIFKNITGSFDYYTKKTTDVMGNSTIDPTLGAASALINYATIRNNGLELSLKADWISNRNFNWNTGLVIAKNSSKVLNVYRTGRYDPQILDVLGYVSGYPVGSMFSYNTKGLNNQGHPIIVDQNGAEYVVNTSSTGQPLVTAMSSKDSGLVQYSGSTLPTINAGLSNRVDIGNFYFFAMINYYGGFKVRVPRPTPDNNRPLVGADNYWKVPGDELKTDIPNLLDLTSPNPSWAYIYNSNYVVSGDYITLGDVTVSYRLNDVKFIKRAGFKNFEIKAQASNLYTLGFNRYNFTMATGSYAKPYVTPTYTLGLFTNF
ncbi:SusC/RagA family TonB-linked outer membrane protein [Pedobacter sp.]|uniref:SusC/RagA family TonB-linked outer membrane protein n=1 Tax=Pedobacter sp. TaxID=1411316 RepID=UPI002BCC9007|nr:SusC/RagA family TonB-linked outer membrane protein [Pedobacter sp.]HWW42008.1 SusC/RagA family TonB-linked outer membrane protein [Pedobacter sp.]